MGFSRLVHRLLPLHLCRALKQVVSGYSGATVAEEHLMPALSSGLQEPGDFTSAEEFQFS